MNLQKDESASGPGFAAKPGSSAGIPTPAWLADHPDQIVCAVNRDYAALVAPKPDAEELNRTFHIAVYDAASHDAIAWLDGVIANDQREEQQLRAEYDAFTAELARTPREIIGSGGGEKRTVFVWIKIVLFGALGLLGSGIDACLVWSLVGEASPEKLADLPYMLATVSLALFGVVALKASTMLGSQEPEALKRRFTFWSRILPFAAVPLLLSLAYRWTELTTNPITVLFAETADPVRDYSALVFFFGQLIAGTIVSTGSLLVAARLAQSTAPATRTPNVAWQALHSARAANAEQLKALQSRLALQSAQRGTLIANRNSFLGDAAVELGVELTKLANRKILEGQLAAAENEKKRVDAEALAEEKAEEERLKKLREDANKRLEDQRKEAEKRLEELRKEIEAQRKETEAQLEAHLRKSKERREQSALNLQRTSEALNQQLGLN